MLKEIIGYSPVHSPIIPLGPLEFVCKKFGKVSGITGDFCPLQKVNTYDTLAREELTKQWKGGSIYGYKSKN